jgi:hypothetical protein
VTHVVHALATSEQGETAAVKLCCAVTGHVSGGGGNGGLGGGGGEGQALMATSDCCGTPSAMILEACALMQMLSIAVLEGATPAWMKRMAMAVAQPEAHAVAGSAHGEAADVKSCCPTEQAGGGGGGGGGDGAAHAASCAAVTPAAVLKSASYDVRQASTSAALPPSMPAPPRPDVNSCARQSTPRGAGARLR